MASQFQQARDFANNRAGGQVQGGNPLMQMFDIMMGGGQNKGKGKGQGQGQSTWTPALRFPLSRITDCRVTRSMCSLDTDSSSEVHAVSLTGRGVDKLLSIERAQMVLVESNDDMGHELVARP